MFMQEQARTNQERAPARWDRDEGVTASADLQERAECSAEQHAADNRVKNAVELSAGGCRVGEHGVAIAGRIAQLLPNWQPPLPAHQPCCASSLS